MLQILLTAALSLVAPTAAASGTAMDKIFEYVDSPIRHRPGFAANIVLIEAIQQAKAYDYIHGKDNEGQACYIRYATGSQTDGAYVYSKVLIPVQFRFDSLWEIRSVLTAEDFARDAETLAFTERYHGGAVYAGYTYRLVVSSGDLRPISFTYETNGGLFGKPRTQVCTFSSPAN